MVERIVSLAPSATNVVRHLGAGDRVVGRTDHGEGPGTPLGGWLTPDLDAIGGLDPDVVLTVDSLQAPLADELRDRDLRTAHYEPATLDEVLETIRAIGSDVDRAAAATRLVDDLRSRLDDIRDGVAGRPRPIVYCEEWQDPPMVAGNWVPDAVATAGGRYPWLDPGERSRPIERETVEAVDPDHVVLHVCGGGAAVDPESVAERGWSLTAVTTDRVTVLDDRLLNQPAPGLVDGIERLAATLHPEAVDRDPERIAGGG